MAVLEGGTAEAHQRGRVERILDPVLLGDRARPAPAGWHVGLEEDPAEVQAAGLGMVDRGDHLQPVGPAHHLLDRPEAQAGHVLAHLGRDEGHEVDDVLRVAAEVPAQLRVLRRHADRTGVEVAGPHHDAAQRDERGGGEAELLRAQQRPDHDVAAGLELPVDLDRDARAQVVHHQDLVGLGQAELPGDAGVLDGGERRGAGPAVVAADQHDVRVGLGDPGGDRPHADLGHQLHADAGVMVRVLEVVDQLGEVLDRVDVVVRRRADQAHPRGGVAGAGDPRVDLGTGELATLARLRPLGHLDLQLAGVDQVLARHPEAAAGDLLDRAVPRVAVRERRVAGRILAPLAGVGLAAQPVHRDRERLVGLRGDGAVAHGAGLEAAHDR